MRRRGGFFNESVAVAGDDPVAEGFVGVSDDGGIDGEFSLARVLGDEFETELVIFEFGGAEVANGEAVALGVLGEKIGGVFREVEFEFVAVVKAFAEFVNEPAEHGAALFLDFSHDFIERGDWIFDEFASDFETLDVGGWQFVFEIAEDALANGHETAGAGLFERGEFGDFAEAFVVEKNVDAVSGEGLFVLANDAAFGTFQDGEEIFGIEGMTDDADGKAADEFRFETEVDEVAGLDVFESAVVFAFARAGIETDGGFAHAPANDFFETVECAADNEEDVFRVDGVAAFFAAHLAFEHGLNLSGEVLLGAGGNFGFLHELEEVCLHAAAADVAGGVAGGTGDFIDFVDINDAVLGALDVTIGAADEFANEIFDIAADVTRFGKFGGVAFHEGNADEIRDATDEVGFADAGGANQDDVLLGVIGLVFAFHGEADMVIMITHRDAEDFFGFVLLDDETIEVIFYFARLFIEAEVAGLGAGGGSGRRFSCVAAGLGTEKGSGVGKMLPHEIGHLPLKLFG